MTTTHPHMKTQHNHTALFPSINLQRLRQLSFAMPTRKQRQQIQKTSAVAVKCAKGIQDFIGGDLVRFDLGRWLSDVEEHKSLAIYSPHEGGYEGRYLNRLRYKGYHFLDLSARGLGDPETTLTKVHPVCPVSLSMLISFLTSSVNWKKYFMERWCLTNPFMFCCVCPMWNAEPEGEVIVWQFHKILFGKCTCKHEPKVLYKQNVYKRVVFLV